MWSGETNIKGPPGAPGADGAVEVYEQPNDPGAVEIGALWIDTDEPPVYGPAGPTGPAGATGPTGPQGLQGIQGIPGPWTQMTQAAYNALPVKDPAVLYVVVG